MANQYPVVYPEVSERTPLLKYGELSGPDGDEEWALNPSGTEQEFVAGGGLVVPKTVGTGIKVDVSDPTFGWKDLLGEISGQGGSTGPRWNTYQGSLKQYQFNRNVTESWINFHLPHDFLPGTDMYIHAHWSQIVVDTGGPDGVPGDVEWKFDISYASGYSTPGGVGHGFSAPVTFTVVQQGSTTQFAHMIAEVQFAQSGGGGGMLDSDLIEIDGILMVRVYRERGNPADTLTEDPFLHYSDCHHVSSGIMGTKRKGFPFYY